MNRPMKILLAFSLINFFFFTSCATKQESKIVVSEQELPPEPEKKSPVVETVEEEPKKVTIVNEETGYEVSKELYEKTRDEISELINTLNSIISSRNYEKWKLFLSDNYIKTFNDPVKLKQISDQSQILSENDIRLLNLKDYFEWVVVPSRSNARVDDIVFIDDSHLIVYMRIKEKNTILYQLESINEDWQISVW